MRQVAVVVILLMALLASAPGAMAQVPAIPSACGPMTISVTGPAGDTAPGGTAAFTVTVANGGSMAIQLVVSGSTAATGWTLPAGDQTSLVNAGESAAFSFNVAAGSDAAPEATVNFLAQGTCQAGAFGCPPGTTACTPQSQTASALARLADPEGFVIPGLADLNITLPFLVGGLLLLVAAALLPMLARRKRSGVTIGCPEPLKMLRRGQGVSFPIELRNRGTASVQVVFELSEVPEGWRAFMAMPDVQLAPGETRSIWLMVRAPVEPETAASADVTVRARASSGEMQRVRVRAEVDARATGGAPAGDGSAP